MSFWWRLQSRDAAQLTLIVIFLAITRKLKYSITLLFTSWLRSSWHSWLFFLSFSFNSSGLQINNTVKHGIVTMSSAYTLQGHLISGFCRTMMLNKKSSSMWSFRKLAAVGHTVMNSCSQCNRRDNSTQHHDIYQWEGHAVHWWPLLHAMSSSWQLNNTQLWSDRVTWRGFCSSYYWLH